MGPASVTVDGHLWHLMCATVSLVLYGVGALYGGGEVCLKRRKDGRKERESKGKTKERETPPLRSSPINTTRAPGQRAVTRWR